MKIMEKLRRLWNYDIMSDAVSKAYELQYELEGVDSKLKCQECHSMLPLFRLILKAKTVSDGEFFNFKCKKCDHVNKIRKEL